MNEKNEMPFGNHLPTRQEAVTELRDLFHMMAKTQKLAIEYAEEFDRLREKISQRAAVYEKMGVIVPDETYDTGTDYVTLSSVWRAVIVSKKPQPRM